MCYDGAIKSTVSGTTGGAWCWAHLSATLDGRRKKTGKGRDLSGTIMPVSDVRKQLNALLGRLKKPVYVTQRGRVRAVIVGFALWERMVDELDVMFLSLLANSASEATVPPFRSVQY